MTSWLGNLSVSRKLGVGFGVVLAITLLLALIGWNSLSKMIFRVDVLGEIARLDSATNRLQISRLEYIVADGSSEAGQHAQDSLSQLQNVQSRLVTIPLTLESNRQMISAMTAPIASYAQALQQVRDAFEETHVARRAMIAAGNTLIEQVNALRDKIRAMDTGIPQRDSLITGFTTFNDEFLMTRYEVRGFMMTRSADRERTLTNQMQKTQAALERTERLLTLYFPGELRQLKAAMQAYFAPLDDYKKHIMAINATSQQLDRHAEELVKLADELQRSQFVLRDEDSAQSRMLQIAAVLVALALGILAAVLISRQITQPLQETLGIAKRIAEGDLTSETRVTRRDELGVLQKGIQDMAGTLRTLISGIRDSATQIASSAEELSVVTEQTSTGVGKQKVETDQVATAMHEMSATVQDVARNAELAAKAANDAESEARQGDRVVTEVVAQIERLAGEVTRSTEAMTQLEHESNKIGSVMDVIKAVAEQTNLLALNAAIEAARAGEAGRGFAVVADEVRTLAQRTQQSTEEIEELVAGLQSGTQRVASSLNSSHALAGNSVDMTRKAGAALSSINKGVSNIQSMNQQIAAAAEQQSVVAEQISRSVISVRDVTEQTTVASQEIAKSSTELARLGNQLTSMVSRFRI